MDISTITSIALDLAGRNLSFQSQNELSDLTLYLLKRGYSIYLFTTNQSENLEKETFEHPRLNIIRKPITPEDSQTAAFPELATADSFWITDNPGLQSWLVQMGIQFAYTTGMGKFGELGVKLGSISDVAGLFNTSGLVIQEVTQAIQKRREAKGEATFVTGVSGPPLSGFQQFAVDLKRELEDMGNPLVDLIDLSSLMPDIHAEVPQVEADDTWVSASAGEWVVHEVLSPLQAGQNVYVEQLPDTVPDAFDAHLPLFIGEGAHVIVLGQSLFKPAICRFLDFSVLLEVSARETTRRLYEIPEGQHFDDRFLNQYFDHEGGKYRDYLDTHKVKETAAARVNAEREGDLTLTHIADIG